MRSMSPAVALFMACTPAFVSCHAPRQERAVAVASPHGIHSGADTQFELVSLRYASATDTWRTLNDALAGVLRIQPDARTNSLILVGAPENVARAKDLIAKLDVEVR